MIRTLTIKESIYSDREKTYMVISENWHPTQLSAEEDLQDLKREAAR